MSFVRNAERYHGVSLSKCYLPNVEIKDLNVLIDRKGFFDLPLKNEEKLKEIYWNE